MAESACTKIISKIENRQPILGGLILHNLHDTFATMLANKNIHRSIVKELLDHSNVAVTSEFYTQVAAKTLKDQFKKITFRKPERNNRSQSRSREQKQS